MANVRSQNRSETKQPQVRKAYLRPQLVKHGQIQTETLGCGTSQIFT